MFNKYRHYIKEPDLVNSNDERIDFLALGKYDFDKEIILLNNIFLKFSDLKEKWETSDTFEKEMDDLIFEFHRFFDVEIKWWFSADYLSNDSSIKSPLLLLEYKDNFSIKIKPLIKILEYYIWDLSRTCFCNDFVQEKNSLFFNEETEITLNNFDDIIVFFEKLKKTIIDMSFRGFQVWYNEKEEEYRKLLIFKEDYFLSDGQKEEAMWNKTDLELVLTEQKINIFISDFLNNLKSEWIIDDFINYSEEEINIIEKNWLYFQKIAELDVNGQNVYLSIISRHSRYHNDNEEVWLFSSFKEKSPEILDFFEKLYGYRKNHLVENTKMKVDSLIDLLDVSPFNNRMNDENINRRNLVIKEIRDNKWFFDSKSTTLAEIIRGNDTIFDSQYSSDYFDKNKLKWNNNIVDFIFEEKNTEFNKIKLNNFEVIEIVKKDWERKCIELSTCEKWKVKYWATHWSSWVNEYLWETELFWKWYYKVTMSLYNWFWVWGMELYIDKNNNAFSLDEIKKTLPYSKILIDVESRSNDFILKNKDKFTKYSFEDHWEKFEHIPSFIGSWEFIVFDSVIKETFNKVFKQQEEIFKGYNNDFIEKYMWNIEIEPVIPSIRALMYFVLEHFEKIEKARNWRILRLRSDTKVPEIDWVYVNCIKSDDDIAWEYYEVVIWEEWLDWKIDISSWSRTELIVDWNAYWSDTSILEIYKKKESGWIHMIVE